MPIDYELELRDRQIKADRLRGLSLGVLQRKYKLSPGRIWQICNNWEKKRRTLYESRTTVPVSLRDRRD